MSRSTPTKRSTRAARSPCAPDPGPRPRLRAWACASRSPLPRSRSPTSPLPIWIFHGTDTTFYGFPVYGEAAVKAARDMSGRFVTQETRSYEPDPDQTAEVAEFLTEYLPGALGPELVSKTCVYDLPADRNFVLDTVPGHPNIAVFVGAGHAAKFAGLIGHILADLAAGGRTDYPIAAFTLDRP